MKLFFELIQKGLPFEVACKGAGVTAEQVKQFLETEGEQITPEQLSDAVAVKVLEKINAKTTSTTPPPAIDAAKLAADIAAAIMPKVDEKIAAAVKVPHQHLDTAGNKAPEIIPGKPAGYAKLHPYQKQLFDMIVASRNGEKGVMLNQKITISDGEANEIRAARKRSGLADMKINGKAITVFGRKALDSSANDGADWIPTNMADMMHLRMGEITSIADIFEKFTQSSATETYPLATTRPMFYLETTTTGSGTESSLRTAAASMVAKKLIGKTDIQDDTSEDSIINLLPAVEQSLVEAAVNCVANVILNGDTTATHMDSDTELVATHANRAWKGLRKLALDVSGLKKDITSGGLSTGNMAALLSLLGKYSLGLNMDRCRIILGVKGTTAWRGQFIDPTTPGGWNALVTGDMPKFLGIQPITESQNREDLNASGVYQTSDGGKGCVLAVYGGGFVLSTYKELTFETERVASSQKIVIYAKMRKAFTPFETPSATIPTVAIGYNYNS